MIANNDEILLAMQSRAAHLRRQAASETPEQRLLRFAVLQRESFELLRSSPSGYQHFLKRNFESRREENDGGRRQSVSSD